MTEKGTHGEDGDKQGEFKKPMSKARVGRLAREHRQAVEEDLDKHAWGASLQLAWPDPQEPVGKRILRLSQQRRISEPELARKLGSVAADPGDHMNRVVSGKILLPVPKLLEVAKVLRRGGFICATTTSGVSRGRRAASGTRRSSNTKIWSGRRDSNSRQPAWRAGALPAELLPRRAVF